MTREELLRRRLARQGLCERLPGPVEVMERLWGIQSQYGISLTPALFARAKEVTQKSTNKLLKDGTFYKTWSVRHTLHAHASKDFGLITHAVGSFFGPNYRQWSPTAEVTWEEIEAQILATLAEGPLTREDLHERVPILKDVQYAGWGRDVKSLAYAGKLYMTEQGASRSKFGLCPFESEPQDLAELYRRYLRGHGPATLADFRYWTGMYVGPVKRAFEAVRPELVEFKLDGQTYYDFPDEPEGEPPKVRLLAKFDAYLLGWKDKSFVREPKAVFRPAGQIESVALLKTDVAATYRMSGGKSIEWFPLRKITKAEQALLEAEAARLLKALAT